jgi:hypothetical protein
MAAQRMAKAFGSAGSRLSLPGVPSFLVNNSTFKAFYAQVQNVAAQAGPAAGWAVPGGIFAVWFVWPALTENFRASVGLPRATPYLPSRPKYQLEEIDQMPTKKG